MIFFNEFVSNTTAGSGNQFYFEASAARTGRVFYRINQPGKMDYSFLFSNIIDSTFRDGRQGHSNLVCSAWQLLGLQAGRCPKEQMPSDFMEPEGARALNDGLVLQPVTIGGRSAVEVAPGSFFATDPLSMTFNEGDYLCLEIRYQGAMVPCHPENLLPLYSLEGDAWVYDRNMPVAGMVGCRRSVPCRIAYLGDSITQGIGCPKNSYLHWTARLADRLGHQYSHWNLGLGYGRANDLATGGAWMYKAVHCDVAVVCYGVNDLRRGRTATQLARDLEKIVELLHRAGVRVLLQTVPPYPYSEEQGEQWFKINAYLRGVLAPKVWRFYDNVPLLQARCGHYAPRYGGHPKTAGCALWAEELYGILNEGLKDL